MNQHLPSPSLNHFLKKSRWHFPTASFVVWTFLSSPFPSTTQLLSSSAASFRNTLVYTLFICPSFRLFSMLCLPLSRTPRHATLALVTPTFISALICVSTLTMKHDHSVSFFPSGLCRSPRCPGTPIPSHPYLSLYSWAILCATALCPPSLVRRAVLRMACSPINFLLCLRASRPPGCFRLACLLEPSCLAFPKATSLALLSTPTAASMAPSISCFSSSPSSPHTPPSLLHSATPCWRCRIASSTPVSSHSLNTAPW